MTCSEKSSRCRTPGPPDPILASHCYKINTRRSICYPTLPPPNPPPPPPFQPAQPLQ
jgi:hypothetical protein